jgi:curli biogenesis system outer membrane secretion channel CsgG
MEQTKWRLLAWMAALVLLTGWPLEIAAQDKTRIAVSAFENKVKTPWGDPSWKIGEGLAEMLTTELIKTGRFTVVERQALGDVVREQELGQSGLVSKGTAVVPGRLIGAQFVVRGAVTEFEVKASGGGGGVTTGQSFSTAARLQNAHVALDLRLIDTSTGQVIASHRAAKIVPAASGAFAAQTSGVRFGADAFYSTPIGQATRAAIQDALQFIVATTPLKTSISSSYSIVKVEGGVAYINAGTNMNVREGDEFGVFSKGEDLVDPDSGLSLGSTEQQIGSIRVTSVQEKFSIATIVSGGGSIKRGDRVKAR